MSIRIDQAAALRQQEEARRKNRTAEGFNDLLSGLAEGGEAQGVAPDAGISRTLLQGLETLRGLEAGEGAQGVSPLADLSAQTADGLDGLLTGFEEYARALTRESGPDLKAAYGLLQRMGGQIAAMREAFPDMAEQSPELAAMMQEMEVMTTAETFKLNRGDYL